jgi:hydroxyacylglutathione hydrolase
MEVFEIPGHSSGHIVFVWRGGEHPVVIAGDVLFAGSIGRTDFPDGDHASLVEGIHNKLFTLPEETLVLPGHGPTTTIGEEKRNNPFVGMPAGYRE